MPASHRAKRFSLPALALPRSGSVGRWRIMPPSQPGAPSSRCGHSVFGCHLEMYHVYPVASSQHAISRTHILSYPPSLWIWAPNCGNPDLTESIRPVLLFPEQRVCERIVGYLNNQCEPCYNSRVGSSRCSTSTRRLAKRSCHGLTRSTPIPRHQGAA